MGLNEVISKSEARSKYCITFDDGQKEFLDCADYLKNYSICGTFYVVPTLVGSDGFLTLSQLHRMRDNGHLIANHGWRHKYWVTDSLSLSEIEEDVSRACEWLYCNNFADGAQLWAVPGGTNNWKTQGKSLLGKYVDQVRLTWRQELSEKISTAGMDDSIFLKLSEPKEKIEITCNPTLVSGRKLHFRAFVVRHNDAIGPAKERGIFVIPDILCNAGGVFVSYLEYTQETQREQMTLDQVERRLSERMRACFADIEVYAAKKMLTMRESAMDLAVNRVVEAIVARGFLP